MCGRFTYLYYWKHLHRLMELTTSPPLAEIEARYNVAPTQAAPVVRATAASDGSSRHRGDVTGRTLGMLRWGLVPSWAKDIKIGNSLVNARAEGIEAKPSFRSAFKRRRCIVPVSGFYEWKRLDEKRKQPYYITSAADDEPLAFAGLWEWWKPPEGSDTGTEPIESFTIITTTPNEMMAALHDRMPVILHPADFAAWLDPANSDSASLLSLLRPYPSELMRCWPVSTRVNSPRFDDPACIEQVASSIEPSGSTSRDDEAVPKKTSSSQISAKRSGSVRNRPDEGKLWDGIA